MRKEKHRFSPKSSQAETKASLNKIITSIKTGGWLRVCVCVHARVSIFCRDLVVVCQTLRGRLLRSVGHGSLSSVSHQSESGALQSKESSGYLRGLLCTPSSYQSRGRGPRFRRPGAERGAALLAARFLPVISLGNMSAVGGRRLSLKALLQLRWLIKDKGTYRAG